MNNGMYVYGIVTCEHAQEFGTIGIGSTPALVYTIAWNGIAAVVSASPFVVYDSLAKEKTIRDLVTHQFVIEKVMERCTILPVKFGTMVADEAAVSEFLAKGFTLLSEALQRMAGKIEVDVVATWDVSKILATLPQRAPHVLEQQRELARKGKQASIEDKIALGKAIAEALKAEKVSYVQRILQALQVRAIETCLHDLASDEMILNAAFLLEKSEEEHFSERLEVLDQELENVVNFRIVGPLPMYSFSTILLKKVDTQRLAEAKKVFDLNDDGEITHSTVRNTYHQLAQKYHPDKSNEASEQDFHRIHAAYKTLKDVSEHGLVQVEVYQWEKVAR